MCVEIYKIAMTKNYVYIDMNQLDIEQHQGKKSLRKCWEERNYSIIIILVGICLLNVYQLTTFDFQAEDILYDLKEWSNSQATKKQLDSVLQVSEQINDLMGQLGNMIDQEDFLLVKIKEYYIDDNREETDIPDIVDFQKKLGKYKHIQSVKEDEHKKIVQKVNRLKFQQGKHIVKDEDFAQFYGLARNISQELHTFYQVLKQIVELNKEWYNESYKKISNEPEKVNIFISQQDVEDLPEYTNLPPLAQEVLRPRPIQLLKQLYKSTSTLHEQPQLQMRQKFMKEREYLSRQFRLLQSFSLSKYNIRSGIEDRSWETDIIGDYPRLNAKFSLSQAKNELGFCIVVPTYNNLNNFRAELNLNSIFSQNYTNYKIVIIDDASKDDTPVLIQKYLDYYKIAPQKCELIVNKVNKKALENIYNAIVNNCNGYDIIIIVDGDDQLVGLNTLKVLNAVYSRQKLGVIYSNFFFYQHNSFSIRLGFNQEYSQKQKENYRKAQQKFSHLISFKRQLFSQIKLEDLQQNGHFYHVAYDFAMIYPLMELSCGKVKYINEYQYLYSIGTGMNDYQLLTDDQKNLGKQILDKPAYNCSQKYRE